MYAYELLEIENTGWVREANQAIDNWLVDKARKVDQAVSIVQNSIDHVMRGAGSSTISSALVSGVTAGVTGATPVGGAMAIAAGAERVAACVNCHIVQPIYERATEETSTGK